MAQTSTWLCQSLTYLSHTVVEGEDEVIVAIVLVVLLDYLGMALLWAVLLVGGGLLVYAVMAGNSKWNQLD